MPLTACTRRSTGGDSRATGAWREPLRILASTKRRVRDAQSQGRIGACVAIPCKVCLKQCASSYRSPCQIPPLKVCHGKLSVHRKTNEICSFKNRFALVICQGEISNVPNCKTRASPDTVCLGQLFFFSIFIFMPDLACYQKVWVKALYCPKMSL